VRKVALKVPVISIVDDDASVRTAADNFISSYGYAVHTFASAEDFLRSAKLDVTSCVVADVQMPGMSGLDLLKVIRGRGNDIPFIFITAFPSESMRTKAAKAGADELLYKPFSCLALIGCIESALKRAGDEGGDKA
jgi:FixJ family two-component response regulator